MLARFECPRCQTVFTRERGDDDAFVECPSCGALAMSIGDATGVDSDALARALSSSHDATQLQNSLSTLPPSQDNEPASDPPEPEPPASSSLDAPPEPSGAVDRPDPYASSSGAGIFSGLLDAPEPPPAPPPPVQKASSSSSSSTASKDASLDLGLDDDFKDFALPATAPGAPALSPAKKTAAPKKPKPTAPVEPSSPTPALPSEASAALSDDAFGALEAAFDVMAAKPVARRGSDGLSEQDRAFLRGDGEVSGETKRPTSSAPPPKRPPASPGQRPPAKSAKPPPKKPKREKSKGLALSDEAKEAAFLRMREGSAPPRKQLPPEMDDGTIEAPLSSTAEATLPQQMAPPREAGRGGPSSSSPEPTDIVEARQRRSDKGKGDKADAKPVRETPSVMRGLPAIALSVAVFVGLAGGAAVGALTAPQAVKRNDTRARAEVQLAEGNRFYEAGRFDDALGKYKAAISIDRAFALAHRAKGAALAKQQRYDEAAEAYKEYLGLEGSAIDASDVKEALARRGLSMDDKKAGGG